MPKVLKTTSFLRYYKDITNFLFWELFGMLDHLHQNHSINL